MAINSNQNNFVGYILILLSLFILVFSTKNIFASVQSNLDIKGTKQLELQSVETELARLNKIKKDFNDNSSSITGDIDRFLQAFDDDAIIKHIYDKVEQVNESKTSISIKSVSLSEGKKSDLGFKEAKINVTARFGSEDALLNLIKYFIHEDAKYTFFIDSITYPAIGDSTSFQASIPLRLFYK